MFWAHEFEHIPDVCRGATNGAYIELVWGIKKTSWVARYSCVHLTFCTCYVHTNTFFVIRAVMIAQQVHIL